MITMVPAIAPSESRSGVVATLTSSRRAVAWRVGERHAVERRAFGRLAPRRAQHLEEARIEDLLEPAPDRLFVAHAVQLFEAAVPAHDAVVAIDDREAVVERLEDVLAELAHPLELVGLDVQLAVEPAVLERRRRLRRDRREQRHVLAAQRLGARLAAERHDGDRPFLRDARHEVVDPGLAPELDLGADRRGAARADRRASACARRSAASRPRTRAQHRRLGAEPDVRDRDELAVAARRRPARAAAPCDRRAASR